MAWQMRRDTAANWASEDPVLAQGEPGFDTTNNEIRIGNGVDPWSNLDPISGESDHTHTEEDIDDLGVYPDATGQPSGKIAETTGTGTWTLVDKPTGGEFDPDEPLDYFTMRDGDGISWTVTIETDGTLTTTAAAGPVTYEDEVQADTPFTYWRLEETSGTTAADEQTNHDGTYVNSPTLGVTGAVDNAVTYNGTDQRTDISPLGAFGSSMASGTTIEFWAKWSHTDANQSICGVLEDGTSTAVEVSANAAGQFGGQSGIGRVSVTIREMVGRYRVRTTARSDLNDGNWHHFAIVFDGDDLDVYVDGTLDNGTTDDAGSAPIEPGDFTYPFMWGCRNLRGSASKHFDGSLDELALYQSALSAARIQDHYDAA